MKKPVYKTGFFFCIFYTFLDNLRRPIGNKIVIMLRLIIESNSTILVIFLLIVIALLLASFRSKKYTFSNSDTVHTHHELKK